MAQLSQPSPLGPGQPVHHPQHPSSLPKPSSPCGASWQWLGSWNRGQARRSQGLEPRPLPGPAFPSGQTGPWPLGFSAPFCRVGSGTWRPVCLPAWPHTAPRLGVNNGRPGLWGEGLGFMLPTWGPGGAGGSGRQPQMTPLLTHSRRPILPLGASSGGMSHMTLLLCPQSSRWSTAFSNLSASVSLMVEACELRQRACGSSKAPRSPRAPRGCPGTWNTWATPRTGVTHSPNPPPPTPDTRAHLWCAHPRAHTLAAAPPCVHPLTVLLRSNQQSWPHPASPPPAASGRGASVGPWEACARGAHGAGPADPGNIQVPSPAPGTLTSGSA